MNLCSQHTSRVGHRSAYRFCRSLGRRFSACVIVVAASSSWALATWGEEVLPKDAQLGPADATTTLEKASISFRIGVPQWMPEQRYRDLLSLFDKYPGVTDDITFFTSATHPPLTRWMKLLAAAKSSRNGFSRRKCADTVRASTCCRRWGITMRTCRIRWRPITRG